MHLNRILPVLMTSCHPVQKMLEEGVIGIAQWDELEWMSRPLSLLAHQQMKRVFDH